MESELEDFNLVDNDDPVLHRPTIPFDFNNPPIDPLELSKRLHSTMKNNSGIGLSANQCGMPWSVFVIESDPVFVFFNPKIIYESENTCIMEEGCLSFPGLMFKVQRPEEVRVRFQDYTGNTLTKRFSGLTARVILHEYDHMRGVCFTSRISRLKKQFALAKFKKIKKDLNVDKFN